MPNLPACLPEKELFMDPPLRTIIEENASQWSSAEQAATKRPGRPYREGLDFCLCRSAASKLGHRMAFIIRLPTDLMSEICRVRCNAMDLSPYG